MELIAKYYETPVSKPIPITIELGTTVQDLIDGMQLPDNAKEQLGVFSEGELLSLDHVLEDDTTVVVGLRQGKEVLSVVATIAIATVAPWAAGALGFTGTAALVASAAITMVGSLVIGALIPPPDLGGSSIEREKADDVYFVTGA